MYFTTPDILIVEDEEFNREIMALRLQSYNYNLRFAVDGQQALDMVKEKKPDVILLDIMLPEIMGLQVLHTLRQQYSMVELPIIMVTAIDEDQRIVRALELGANDYASKPINFPILIARLQTQLSLKQLSALNNEFLTTASHDLRKPLAIIQDVAATSRLKATNNQAINNDEMMHDFSVISESANFMNSIVECILNTQAGGFGQIRLTKIPLQAEPLISEAINRHFEHANEKNINLVSKVDEDTPAIEVDRSRIAQVIDNLVDNAIKFCSANDTVTISTKVDNESLSIIVSDTGPGLKDNEFDQLFIENIKLSNKPTNNEPHTGLGLSICKQLIDLHDGEIGAMNNNDGGIRFWFKLPAFKLKSV
jgi:two-component system, sensor histidine kinase and response regulator